MMSYEIAASTMTILAWMCLLGAVDSLFGIVNAYRAQNAQIQALRAKLVSSFLAANSINVENKSLKIENADLLELLADAERRQNLRLIDVKVEQLANIELHASIDSLEKEVEVYKAKMRKGLEELTLSERSANGWKEKLGEVEAQRTREQSLMKSYIRKLGEEREKLEERLVAVESDWMSEMEALKSELTACKAREHALQHECQVKATEAEAEQKKLDQVIQELNIQVQETERMQLKCHTLESHTMSQVAIMVSRTNQMAILEKSLALALSDKAKLDTTVRSLEEDVQHLKLQLKTYETEAFKRSAAIEGEENGSFVAPEQGIEGEEIGSLGVPQHEIAAEENGVSFFSIDYQGEESGVFQFGDKVEEYAEESAYLSFLSNSEASVRGSVIELHGHKDYVRTQLELEMELEKIEFDSAVRNDELQASLLTRKSRQEKLDISASLSSRSVSDASELSSVDDFDVCDDETNVENAAGRSMQKCTNGDAKVTDNASVATSSYRQSPIDTNICPTIMGWLWMRRNVFFPWRKRYFMLSREKLEYFTSKKPRGIAVVARVKETKNKCGLKIFGECGKTIEVRAFNSQIKESWRIAFEESLARRAQFRPFIPNFSSLGEN
jgi:hypothetical protein